MFRMDISEKSIIARVLTILCADFHQKQYFYIDTSTSLLQVVSGKNCNQYLTKFRRKNRCKYYKINDVQPTVKS